MITIIDYGIGNLGSIRNMFKRIGVAVQVSADLGAIADAEKLILPGVGAFDNAMGRLSTGRLREILDDKAMVEKTPILGVCLGMQLLTRRSDEGSLPGLGWIAADTRRILPTPSVKVPHMGWNAVRQVCSSPLTQGLSQEARFYFVHSYCVHVDNPVNSVLRARHGVDFDAAVQSGNVFGVQFHPEKSHRFGMQLLANFARL
jgi:imidazole glycerol-phosphate synthase subunit HisH